MSVDDEAVEPAPTVQQIIMQLVDAFDDADELVAAVLDKVGLPEAFRPVFWSLVRVNCHTRLRERARANAPVWTRDGPDPLETTPPSQVNLTAVGASSIVRPTWMRERFALADGRMVTWADATIADHEARIGFQLKFALGIKRDIDNHKEAIRRIKAAKANCLADLPEYGGKPVAA